MDDRSTADETDLFGSLAHDLDHATQRLLGLYDVPAYVRRALRVEEGVLRLEQKIETQRREFLVPVRQALTRWNQACQKYPSARTIPPEAARPVLRTLADALPSDPPLRIIPLVWPVRPRRLWRDLTSAIPTFNQRWRHWLSAVDLDPVNQLIDSYNRNYLIEKECAFRSVKAAARGFQPMRPLERKELAERFPCLIELPE